MNRQLGALALLNPTITAKRPDIDMVFNDGKLGRFPVGNGLLTIESSLGE